MNEQQRAKINRISELLETAISDKWSFEYFWKRVDDLSQEIGETKAPVAPVEVASEVAQFLLAKYGQDIHHPVVLEGLYLAMQMVGGPGKAAQTISYCLVKVA